MTKHSLVLVGGFAGLSLFVTAGASGAASFTGATINENFDGMPIANQTNFLAATKVTVPGTIFEAVDTDGTGSPTLTADDGSSNAGGIHSYGAGNASSTPPVTFSNERALGSLASGSALPAFGVEITNNTANALVSVTVSFNQEVWRTSTSAVNTLQAQYMAGTAGLATYLTATGFTDVDALDVVGPAAVTTNGAVDGNTQSTPRTATISFASSPIAVGQSFYLRFTDTNETGNDAGLAIDGFSFAAVQQTVSPEPATLAALGLSGVLFRRRRV